MKRPFKYISRQRQEGSVAVEAAVCIALVLAPLILFIFVFGRFFWYYTAVQKAIHDATLYLASAPLSEIKSPAALNLASDILARETADLSPDTTIESAFNCGYKISPNFPDLAFSNCSGSTTPDAVQTFAIVSFPMPFFSESESIQIRPIAVMAYVGK
ncbi:hypothetical protein SRABI118_02089 [Massilia sp. Bi118]|uniref:TadE/TadG family type IV pilus assembly protein n=1 Tax=Massilia sp. Bi118 TaxID=2822346 RepID=UPI001DC4FC15|nr:TadE family protein [Massilia sp. Bi118]CAH0215423.1 hypothetical protein SRABI118_02089 [Massilia sp. Bi118]